MDKPDGPSPTARLTPRLFRVIVPVTDIDQASNFYSALLGITGETVSTNRCYFNCGGVILVCVDPRGDNREFHPNPDHTYFSVADLEAAYERAQGAGCSWLDDQIRTRPWDERSFYLRDPFENPLCIVEAGTEFMGGRFVP